MTDPLTDAVRRLKALQEDVERLKAGRDQEGEPRIFLTEQDRGVATDVFDLRAADIDAEETPLATDVFDLRAADIDAEETALATDTQALRLQREHEAATWGTSGWGTSGYND